MNVFDYLVKNNIQDKGGMNWGHFGGVTEKQAHEIKELCDNEDPYRQCDIYKEKNGTYSGRFHY